MKKALFLLLSLFAASAAFAAPNTIHTVTIVNHFDDTLRFTISDHREIVPDLPEKFALYPKDKLTTRVIVGNQNANEAYIIVESEKDPENKEAFWGIDSDSIHGYVDTHIAYSWSNNSTAKITFCTPEDYAKHGKCI